MGKQEMRKRLAALSFDEKIKILEKLRERDKVIAASGPRRKAAKDCDSRVSKKSAKINSGSQ